MIHYQPNLGYTFENRIPIINIFNPILRFKPGHARIAGLEVSALFVTAYMLNSQRIRSTFQSLNKTKGIYNLSFACAIGISLVEGTSGLKPLEKLTAKCLVIAGIAICAPMTHLHLTHLNNLSEVRKHACNFKACCTFGGAAAGSTGMIDILSKRIILQPIEGSRSEEQTAALLSDVLVETFSFLPLKDHANIASAGYANQINTLHGDRRFHPMDYALGSRRNWHVSILHPFNGNVSFNQSESSATSSRDSWSFALRSWSRDHLVLKHDKIYCCNDNSTLYCVNIDGQEQWRFRASDSLWSCPVIDADANSYVIDNANHIYCIDANGNQKWSDGTRRLWQLSSPAIDKEGNIYCVGHDQGSSYFLYPWSSEGEQQQEILITNNDTITSSVVIDDHGHFYLSSRSGKLYCIDGRTKTLKWMFDANETSSTTPTVGHNGDVYFGSRNTLYCIGSDGNPKWNFNTEDTIESIPAIGFNSNIYFGSNDKNLYCLNDQGSLQWKFKTKYEIKSSPVISHNGNVYFGSRYTLYCLNPSGESQWELNDTYAENIALDCNGNVCFYEISKLRYYKPNSLMNRILRVYKVSYKTLSIVYFTSLTASTCYLSCRVLKFLSKKMFSWYKDNHQNRVV